MNGSTWRWTLKSTRLSGSKPHSWSLGFTSPAILAFWSDTSKRVIEPIPLLILINPLVTPLTSGSPDEPPEAESIWVYEGCLSVPGLRGRVRRPRRVRVRGLDAEGRPLDLVWEGFRAAVVQHEVDHLNATLFVDRALPGTLTFLREYERYVARDARVIDGAVPASAALL